MRGRTDDILLKDQAAVTKGPSEMARSEMNSLLQAIIARMEMMKDNGRKKTEEQLNKWNE